MNTDFDIRAVHHVLTFLAAARLYKSIGIVGILFQTSCWLHFLILHCHTPYLVRDTCFLPNVSIILPFFGVYIISFLVARGLIKFNFFANRGLWNTFSVARNQLILINVLKMLYKLQLEKSFSLPTLLVEILHWQNILLNTYIHLLLYLLTISVHKFSLLISFGIHKTLRSGKYPKVERLCLQSKEIIAVHICL